MKHIYLFLALFNVQSSWGQNWDPFPYDSLYFSNVDESSNDIYIPFVKSQSSTEFLIPMSTSEEDEVIRYVVSEYDFNPSEDMHWFGQDLKDSLGVLQFSSLYFNEILEIDLHGELYQADTQLFYLNDSIPYYLSVRTDSFYFDGNLNDSIKQISLRLLNAQYEEEEMDYDITDFPGDPSSVGACFNALLNVSFSTYNKQILIGKTQGIIEIPNLTFYPYCKSYKKSISVDSLHHILTTPLLQVGDRYEMVNKNLDLNSYQFDQFEYATEITHMSNVTANAEFVYTVKQWKNRVPYSGYQNYVNPESSYEDNKVITIPYGYNNIIFNGINENIGGKVYFLRMHSYWGLPMLEPLNGSYLPLNIDNEVEYVSLINVVNIHSKQYALSGYYDENCLTYYKIGDLEFGTTNMLEIDEWSTDHTISILYQNGRLTSNLPLTGLVQVYSVNGQELYSKILTESVTELQELKLNKGVYFLRLEGDNKTVKFVVNHE